MKLHSFSPARVQFCQGRFSATLFGASLVSSLWLSSLGCGSSAPPAAAPEAASPPAAAAAGTDTESMYETAPPGARQAAPADVPSAAWHFPEIVDGSLKNGLVTKLVKRSGLPVVDLRLVVFSGSASDGTTPGVASLAGEMLKVGGTGTWSSRELLERVESLGASLDVSTGRDSTTLHLAVPSDQFEVAVNLLASIVQKPRFDGEEFTKLKHREIDRVESLSRTSAGWLSARVLYDKLYAAPGTSTADVKAKRSNKRHPYAAFDSSAAELTKRSLFECKTWYRTNVSPKNAVLIVAGNLEPARLTQSASKEFGAWNGPKAPTLTFPEVAREPGLKLFLVDRPRSPQAEVSLALWGPERKSPDFVPMAVTNQILGGGVSGRLFGDVREKRSLAYSTYSTYERIANGPSPLLLKAGTQTAKAGLTLQALLEHAAQLSTPPSDSELKLAVRYQTDIFLLRAETAASVASMSADLSVFGLSNDYYDRFREQVGTTSAAQVLDIGRRYYQVGTSAIAVVVGDVERLSTPLSHFADVYVIDPELGLGVKQKIPQNAAAPIELQRVDGT